MSALKNIEGKTFGNWLVLYRNGSSKNKSAIWRCRCLLCGQEKDVVGLSLINGHSTKCRACVPKTTLSKPHRGTRLYHIYSAMKQRCTNPKNKSYSNYGGRGISMCNEWLNNPDAFIEWAIANGYNDGLTIDRIDNNRNYSPENCRWIPSSIQSSNRRSCIHIEYNGFKYPTLQAACLASSVCYESVKSYKRRHDVSYQQAFDHFVF